MENAAESHLELLPNGSRLHTPLATSSVTVRKPINMTRSCAEAADDNFPFSWLLFLSSCVISMLGVFLKLEHLLCILCIPCYLLRKQDTQTGRTCTDFNEADFICH